MYRSEERKRMVHSGEGTNEAKQNRMREAPEDGDRGE